MLISGLQSSTSLLNSLTSTSQSGSSTSGNQNTFDTALSNLISSIQSGDTTSAEKYLAQVQELTPANADSNSPLGQFISSVSSALQSNDISSAQSALTTLESQPAPSNTQVPPPPTSDSTSSTISEYTQDIVNLFSTISSGDLSGAQSAYDSLTSLLLGNSSSVSTSSTDSDSSASSSSPDGSSLATLLQNIGSALGSGDISSAQSSLDSFLKSLSTGSLVNATA